MGPCLTVIAISCLQILWGIDVSVPCLLYCGIFLALSAAILFIWGIASHPIVSILVSENEIQLLAKGRKSVSIPKEDIKYIQKVVGPTAQRIQYQIVGQAETITFTSQVERLSDLLTDLSLFWGRELWSTTTNEQVPLDERIREALKSSIQSSAFVYTAVQAMSSMVWKHGWKPWHIWLLVLIAAVGILFPLSIGLRGSKVGTREY